MPQLTGAGSQVVELRTLANAGLQ